MLVPFLGPQRLDLIGSKWYPWSCMWIWMPSYHRLWILPDTSLWLHWFLKRNPGRLRTIYAFLWKDGAVPRDGVYVSNQKDVRWVPGRAGALRSTTNLVLETLFVFVEAEWIKQKTMWNVKGWIYGLQEASWTLSCEDLFLTNAKRGHGRLFLTYSVLLHSKYQVRRSFVKSMSTFNFEYQKPTY